MVKKPIRLRIIVVLYFIVGIFNLFIGISNERNIAFLFIGSLCVILSFGIFKLWNWARIAAIIISSFFIFVYILLIIGTVKGYWQGWGGIGLFFNFPILLLSLFSIDVLFRQKIKELFSKK